MIFSLLLAGIFMVMPTYMDQLTALGFSPEEMRIWVYRVVVPTYFLTIAYFSYRYLSGKNPTSTVWPILIVTFFFLISQIVGFVFFFFSLDTVLLFIYYCSLVLCFERSSQPQKKRYFWKLSLSYLT
ncbi:hypothetical protein OA001_00390 [bacterium]|nr:hypothetical protein [bacterium]MDC3018795.1 hypothetical protein [bacterium]